MSATVIEIATADVVEAVEADATEATTKATPKKRDLKKIGKHLARQITRQGITEFPLDAVMAAKLVDRVQAKAIVAHAKAIIEARGGEFPAGVGV